MHQFFRDNKMSNDTAKAVVRWYANDQFQKYSEYGMPLDQAEQTQLLKEKWGEQTAERQKAVKDFARTLPRSVFQAPLNKSAEGWELMHRLMESSTGPELLDTSSTATTFDINGRQQEIMNDPAYWTDTKRGSELQEEWRRLENQKAK